MKPNMRLTIESKSGGGNFADSPPETWQTVRVEWFAIEPLSGREYEQAQSIQSATTHKAECEYFAGFSSSTRLRTADSSRVFNVESVFNRGERNRKLDWRLVEVEPDPSEAEGQSDGE